MDTKEYKFMTPEEQMAWLTDFAHWSNEKMPVLCALGNAWESSHIKSMEEGLKLISAFSYCRDFVQKSLYFRDFSRRVDRLRFYVEKIKTEVAAGMAVKTESGQTLAFVPKVQTRRRGRPTREEAAQMARERMEQEVQRKHEEAVAQLSGLPKNAQEKVIESPKNVKKEEKNVQQPSLFENQAESKQPVSNLAAAVALTQGEGRLHLDQLAWLMSDGLKMRIKEIAGLRAVAAKEAEQAKALAENNVPQAVIEPHSRAAVEAKEKYLAIYADVDKELGEMYSLLSIGGEHMPKYEKMCQARGITIAQLKDILKPYWDKAGQPLVKLESITDPQPEESEEEKSKRNARLHAIRTYFMRKDCNLTQKRIEKMRVLIEEVKGYGLPTDEYEAVLATSIKDLENNKEEV